MSASNAIEPSANGSGINGENTPSPAAATSKDVPAIEVYAVPDEHTPQNNGDTNPPIALSDEDDTEEEDDDETENDDDSDSNDRYVTSFDADGATYSDQQADEDSSEWEEQSLYEDMLAADMREQASSMDTNAFCTAEESKMYKELLRKVGSKAFVDQTVANGTITAKKLITAFGIRPPAFLEGTSDASYFTLLGLAMQRELARRLKLPHINTVEDVVNLLQKSSSIMVLTGAGISTSLGIPDFRSEGSGLYSRLEGLGLSDPQQVFDIELFREDPSVFYSVAKDILPATKRFSPTHAFIELLQRKGKLLRNYTQNIDNLEFHAGIRQDKLIQCHGSFATATCIKCNYQVPGEQITEDLRAGQVARCERCIETLDELVKNGVKKRRRGKVPEKSRKNRYSDDSSDEEDDDIPEPGVMKPDIIFFGEQLPDRFHRIVEHDRAKVDLLICIGTSLKVAPVSELTAFLPANVPQIYISREPVYHVDFDVELLGNLCDDICVELSRRAGWNDDLKHEMIPENLEVKEALQDGTQSRYYFARINPSPPLAPPPVPAQQTSQMLAPPAPSGPTSVPPRKAPTSAPALSQPASASVSS